MYCLYYSSACPVDILMQICKYKWLTTFKNNIVAFTALLWTFGFYIYDKPVDPLLTSDLAFLRLQIGLCALYATP